jgi:RNA polymerase sigma-70 factor (ECF subfamily)
LTQRDEDAELMLSLGRGEIAAFDQLFERWAARLQRYLLRIVPDAGTAEELVQEAFLRLYRARQRYRAESRFSTWLYRIATNLALNELRRPRRRAPHASTDASELSGPLTAAGAGPELEAEARLLAERVQRELARIPERQRIALWLCAVEQHSYAEAARALETTEASVKSLVHRARTALAVGLEQGAAQVPRGSARDECPEVGEDVGDRESSGRGVGHGR